MRSDREVTDCWLELRGTSFMSTSRSRRNGSLRNKKKVQEKTVFGENWRFSCFTFSPRKRFDGFHFHIFGDYVLFFRNSKCLQKHIILAVHIFSVHHVYLHVHMPVVASQKTHCPLEAMDMNCRVFSSGHFNNSSVDFPPFPKWSWEFFLTILSRLLKCKRGLSLIRVKQDPARHWTASLIGVLIGKKSIFLVFMLVSSVVWNFRTSCYHLIRFIVIKYAQPHRN